MQLSNVFIANENYRNLFKAEQATDADFACSILSYEACRLAYEYGEEWLTEVINIIDTNKKNNYGFYARVFSTSENNTASSDIFIMA